MAGLNSKQQQAVDRKAINKLLGQYEEKLQEPYIALQKYLDKQTAKIATATPAEATSIQRNVKRALARFETKMKALNQQVVRNLFNNGSTYVKQKQFRDALQVANEARAGKLDLPKGIKKADIPSPEVIEEKLKPKKPKRTNVPKPRTPKPRGSAAKTSAKSKPGTARQTASKGKATGTNKTAANKAKEAANKAKSAAPKTTAKLPTAKQINDATRYSTTKGAAQRLTMEISPKQRLIMEQMENNLNNRISEISKTIGRRHDDAVRAIQLPEVRAIVENKEAAQKLAPRLRAALDDANLIMTDGKVKWVELSGRKYELRKYSEMVARTITREAMTIGTIEQIKASGGDLVEIDTTVDCCDLCKEFQGKIYSISGTSTKYQALTQYPPYHPNCGHVLMPFVEKNELLDLLILNFD